MKPQTNGRVVIIEDEPDIAEVISYNLEREGYAVSTCEDGLQGLDSVRREPPDLVLLDLMLPGMDGIWYAASCARTRALRTRSS